MTSQPPAAISMVPCLLLRLSHHEGLCPSGPVSQNYLFLPYIVCVIEFYYSKGMVINTEFLILVTE